MTRYLASLLLMAMLALFGPTIAAAQEAATLDEADGVEDVGVEDVGIAQEVPAADQAPGIYTDDSFEKLAQRAEDLAAMGDASLFAVGRLRSELVVWRDKFIKDATVNAGRIATVDAQLAALGPVPESGGEPAAVAARRAELLLQRQNLHAPRLLAQEAHARANGIIGEFDAIALQRETAELGVRSPSPLSPTHLVAALTALWGLTQVIGVELAAGIVAGQNSGALSSVLPRAVVLFILGIGLLGVGRRFVTAWREKLETRAGRWRATQLFLLSLVQIIVPIVGLLITTEALRMLGVFGLRSGDVLDAVPSAGGAVIFGWWLSRHVFPLGTTNGFLGYDEQTRAKGRRYTASLAWVLALGILINGGLRTIDTSAGTSAAIVWPILTVLGVLFWRMGRVIQTVPQEIEGRIVSAGRMRGYMGHFCVVVAIIAPVIAAFGFVAAGRALLIPAIASVGLIGVLLLLQRIGHDFSQAYEDEEDRRGLYALLPVFISLALYLASLPIFALIWGARVDDLSELWTRFSEGYGIGETRISPTDFVMFVVVFSVGYILTRFIQGTLRKSVMPRTRLDLGGQNAVVAGFGYVGIMLAAIVAITSAGIDLSNLAIVAGALSVGIGFGLQNIVSNFVSGIILLIERPVSEGDWIEVGGQMGYVRAISVRSTRIETFDRTDVIIPNADLVSGQVTNWTRGNLVGRVIVPVGVAYGSDVDEVTRILRGIAEAHPLVIMTPPPAVIFQGFGADSLDFEIRAILRDVNYVLVTKSEMNHEIAKQFAAAGIEIPFAQRDIWLRNPEVLKGAI
jgi:potassium efflux system protein